MADGPVNPELNQPSTDIYQVRVVESDKIYEKLQTIPMTLSRAELKSSIFQKEETNAAKDGDEDGNEEYLNVFTIINQNEDRLIQSDKGFYDSIDVDTVVELLQKRGLKVGVSSRPGRVRNVIIEKNDVCVAVNLGTELTEGDVPYMKEELVDLMNEINSSDSKVKNDMILISVIDRESIIRPQLKLPSFPKNKEEFAHIIKTYAEIYQVFLNVMLTEEGEVGAPRIIELSTE